MKIIFFANYYYPHAGGVEKHIKSVSNELMQMGHEIKIITIKHDQSWPDRELIDGVYVIRRPDFRLPKVRYFQALLWLLGNWKLLAWADVFHGHDSYFPQLRYLFPKKRFVHTFHGYEGYPLGAKTIKRRQWIAKQVSAVVQVGDFIEKWYGTKPDYVTYGGVSKQPGTKKATSNGLIFVGRLEPDTGIKLYLQALKILKDNGFNMHLTVCGDGSLMKELKEYAVAFDLNISFHGMVDDVNQYLGGAQIAFVAGYLAILEAMAMGKNIICVYDNPLKFDYLSLMPHAQEFMIIANNPEEVASGVQSIMSHPEKFRKLADKAQEWALKQTWKRLATDYIHLYNQ